MGFFLGFGVSIFWGFMWSIFSMERAETGMVQLKSGLGFFNLDFF